MKNRFFVEQLEPRILLSGDLLTELLPLLESGQSVLTVPASPQENTPASLVSPLLAVPLLTSTCTVIVDNNPGTITQSDLMSPFDGSSPLVVESVDQKTLLTDFSSDYSFTTAEWDALEDGWRHLSSLLGATLSSEGLVPLIPFVDNGGQLYGNSNDLANLLQQPLADYASLSGQSPGGLLDSFSTTWTEGDLVVLGKILGGYNAGKDELRFDLAVRIEKTGRTALDFSTLKAGTGLNLQTQDPANYKSTLTLDLQFGLNVVSDTFFMALPDGSLSVQVESGNLAAQTLFLSPAGLQSVSASGDIELNADFFFSSETGRVIGASDQGQLLTASPISSGLAINLAFSGSDVYQGIESLTVSSADLFNAVPPEVLLQGSNLHLWNSTLDANLYVGSGEKLSGSGTLAGSLVNAGLVSPGNSPGIQSVARAF
ncbi:MAG: LEPR-XLL domain-containing protein [Chlorobium sp.]